MAVPYRLFDMHCHLDRMSDALGVAREAKSLGLALFCTTVSPCDYGAARRSLGEHPNVRIGVGLHPWRVDDGSCGADDAEQAAALAAGSRWVGEVGLDFGRAHVKSREEQLDAFELICRACGEAPLPGRVLSIHAVRSAGVVLDVLEHCDLTRQAACVFHWFSGTSEELARARRIGCYFSVNEMMLGTRKGLEYARQIPVESLLLETDAPPKLDAPYIAAETAASLERALALLAAARQTNREDLAKTLAGTSRRLLDL